MTINILTLGEWTCIAIIMAMLVLIYRTLAHPLNSFLDAINPFKRYQMIKGLQRRVEELELEIMNLRYDIKTKNKETKKC
jgi:hypothetical protein